MRIGVNCSPNQHVYNGFAPGLVCQCGERVLEFNPRKRLIEGKKVKPREGKTMKIGLFIRDDNSGKVEIYPYKTEGGNVMLFHDVTVSRSTSLDSLKLDTPQINWPSIGVVTPEEADLFAEAIRAAATIARLWAGGATRDESVEALKRHFEVVTKKESDAYYDERQAARAR